MRAGSEIELQSELDFTLVVLSVPRRGDPAERRVCVVERTWRSCHTVTLEAGWRKVWSICQVEELGPELEADPFSNLKVLE